MPPGNATGFSAVKTALRGWLRRPGPTSIPQAVSFLPSIAKPIGPVTRFLPLLSSKIDSSGASGGLTSAVARENFTVDRTALSIRRRRLDTKFRERARPLDRPPRATHRQVRVVEQLQPKRRDRRDVGFHRHLDRVLGRRIPLDQERAIVQGVILRAPGRFFFDLRPHDHPRGLSARSPASPTRPSAPASRDYGA